MDQSLKRSSYPTTPPEYNSEMFPQNLDLPVYEQRDDEEPKIELCQVEVVQNQGNTAQTNGSKQQLYNISEA